MTNKGTTTLKLKRLLVLLTCCSATLASTTHGRKRKLSGRGLIIPDDPGDLASIETRQRTKYYNNVRPLDHPSKSDKKGSSTKKSSKKHSCPPTILPTPERIRPTRIPQGIFTRTPRDPPTLAPDSCQGPWKKKTKSPKLPTAPPIRPPPTISPQPPTSPPLISPTPTPTLQPTDPFIVDPQTLSPSSAPTDTPPAITTDLPTVTSSTEEATEEATQEITATPAPIPTLSPTIQPTLHPTGQPSLRPSPSPTVTPTLRVTPVPTNVRTLSPTESLSTETLFPTSASGPTRPVRPPTDGTEVMATPFSLRYEFPGRDPNAREFNAALDLTLQHLEAFLDGQFANNPDIIVEYFDGFTTGRATNPVRAGFQVSMIFARESPSISTRSDLDRFIEISFRIPAVQRLIRELAGLPPENPFSQTTAIIYNPTGLAAAEVDDDASLPAERAFSTDDPTYHEYEQHQHMTVLRILTLVFSGTLVMGTVGLAFLKHTSGSKKLFDDGDLMKEWLEPLEANMVTAEGGDLTEGLDMFPSDKSMASSCYCHESVYLETSRLSI